MTDNDISVEYEYKVRYVATTSGYVYANSKEEAREAAKRDFNDDYWNGADDDTEILDLEVEEVDIGE